MELANNIETIAAIIIVVVLGIVLEVFIYIQTYGGIGRTSREKRDTKKRVGLAMIFIVALLVGIELILLGNRLFNGV